MAVSKKRPKTSSRKEGDGARYVLFGLRGNSIGEIFTAEENVGMEGCILAIDV